MSTVKVQRAFLEGREHFVVPTVMIVEGVLWGSGVPLYYPAAELEKSTKHWNGRPVVVYHPDMHGTQHANRPEVFNLQRIGTLFNTKFDKNRLVAECWIDVLRVKAVDIRVHDAIVNRKMLEVSTGVYVDSELQRGEFGGRGYEGIAFNLRPDHFAVLPDRPGACSIADGAGLCRNEASWQVQEPLGMPCLA